MSQFDARRTLYAVIVSLSVIGAVAPSARAQIQNPIQAAKDAYKKARQQQQQQSQQGQPQQGQAQTASSPSAVSNRSGGQASEASSGAATAPVTADDLAKPAPTANVVLDPIALPDIVGVHLGMPLRTAAAALQAAYPNVKITPSPALQMPTINQPVAYSVSTWSNNAFEVVTVGVVLPPNQQIVWAMTRWINTPPGGTPMNRAELLANLRKKYGKETYNSVNAGGPSARSDAEITDLYWIYDEGGKRIPQPNPAFGVSGGGSGCLGNGAPRDQTIRPPGLSGNETHEIHIQSEWCKSTYVGVHANLTADGRDPANFISMFTMDMEDLPLAMRAEKATVDLYQKAAERRHQEEINRSKSVQPKF